MLERRQQYPPDKAVLLRASAMLAQRIVIVPVLRMLLMLPAFTFRLRMRVHMRFMCFLAFCRIRRRFQRFSPPVCADYGIHGKAGRHPYYKLCGKQQQYLRYLHAISYALRKQQRQRFIAGSQHYRYNRAHGYKAACIKVGAHHGKAALRHQSQQSAYKRPKSPRSLQKRTETVPRPMLQPFYKQIRRQQKRQQL